MTEHYRTEHGSRVKISGKHRGISVIDFDWVEEHACIEASVVADVPRGLPGRLSWSCDCHDSGEAALVRCDA